MPYAGEAHKRGHCTGQQPAGAVPGRAHLGTGLVHSQRGHGGREGPSLCCMSTIKNALPVAAVAVVAEAHQYAVAEVKTLCAAVPRCH